MGNGKGINIFTGLLVIAVIILSVLLLKTSAEKKLAEGNYLLSTLQVSGAINAYKRAKTLWPFITKNPGYKKGMDNANSLLSQRDNEPLVTFFFKTETDISEIQALRKTIENIPGVKSVEYISEEEAMEKYKKQIQDPLLEGVVSKELFPSSLAVFTDIPTQSLQETIVTTAQELNFVDEIFKTPIR